MPELPEVETVVRGLARLLVGRRIDRVEVLHRPSIDGSPSRPEVVVGKRVECVWRRGKFIRIDLSGEMGLAVHLRMTGWMGVRSAKTPRDPYVRVVFHLDDGRQLVFHDVRTFGRVWFGPGQQLDSLPGLTKLGPEPLEIEPGEFTRRLRARSGRLKALLLNQEFLAGVGNIYADESLYAAQLHPLREAKGVPRAKAVALLQAIQQVLRNSIAAGGTSIENFRDSEGRPGFFQAKLLAYGRAGAPCGRCGTAIKRIVVGQRGTWFCPRCQKRR